MSRLRELLEQATDDFLPLDEGRAIIVLEDGLFSGLKEPNRKLIVAAVNALPRLLDIEEAGREAERVLNEVGKHVSLLPGLHPDVLPTIEHTLAALRAALDANKEAE